MNWKKKLWKYATGIVVVLLVLNPEMLGLALFIDAFGLEMLVILIEIQATVVLGHLFGPRLYPVINGLRQCFRYVVAGFNRVSLSTQSSAVFMQLLVVSSTATAMLNTI
jgi:hypothetical protein